MDVCLIDMGFIIRFHYLFKWINGTRESKADSPQPQRNNGIHLEKHELMICLLTFCLILKDFLNYINSIKMIRRMINDFEMF